MKFTTHNCVVILIETVFMNKKCFHKKLSSGFGAADIWNVHREHVLTYARANMATYARTGNSARRAYSTDKSRHIFAMQYKKLFWSDFRPKLTALWGN